MSNILKVDVKVQKKPRVIEIIGPAGAGKTTLYNELNKYPGQIHLGKLPNPRKINNAPLFFWYGIQLIPTLFRVRKTNSRQFNRREFAWLSILYGWSHILQRDLKKFSQVIVLDQGPVYLLADMREFGPEYLLSKDAEKLWRDLYRRWAATLDMVVWLDTNENELFERIHTRNKNHPLKNASIPVSHEFFTAYRRAFDYALSMLEANSSGFRVLRVDTSRQKPSQIAESLLAEFDITQQPT